MIDIEKTCRTCMKSDVSLVDLFGPIKIENNSSLKLADALMEATPLQIAKEDGLPQNLCDECVKALQIMHIFRTQALHVESELRKLILSSASIKNEENDYDLKNEFDYMGDYDDFRINDVLSNEETKDKTSYSCNTCKKKYTNYEKYLKHKSVHEPTKSCPNCNKKFYRKSLLKEHMNKSCELNDSNIESVGADIEEELDIKVKLEDEEHKCPECSITFQSQKYLLLHLKEHKKTNLVEQKLIDSIQEHNGTIDNLEAEIKIESSTDQFKCSQCNLVFEKYRSLISHSKKHKNLSKNGIFKCNYCDRGFSSKGPLKRHLLLHSQERPFKCTKCPKCYVRRDALVAHMRKHSDVKRYTCEHCNKAFIQLCTLKDHIRTHTGETPFLCSECGRGFKNSSNLRQHLARHSGLKPFACNLCPKTFCTKGQMKCHMVSHTGVQPYKCNECGASFTKANSLKKHKLIHLGLKPFACDNCNMRFTAKDHLTRHVRTHTGEKPYRCPHCARAFTQSNDLAKHVRAHVGQNIYQCTVCQARFRLMRELRLHYPVHYAGTESAALTDKEEPLVILKGCSDSNIDNNIDKTATDAQITITFNRNILDKDGTGDITINIGPEKIN
ncbi:gastrula zinc finger protein XlCGF57.1-like [Vanessa tameamea]|uniref:Gastrula zinc finger protein XlCGF57.1-like n=1 Tax=Vanessa tameamea TaxID=334116 RepID=A0ABM4APL6_VANTA